MIARLEGCRRFRCQRDGIVVPASASVLPTLPLAPAGTLPATMKSHLQEGPDLRDLESRRLSRPGGPVRPLHCSGSRVELSWWRELAIRPDRGHECWASIGRMLSRAVIVRIHSMLEYPRWYAYSLGIAAFLLGASESAAMTIDRRTGGNLVRVLILRPRWIAVANIYQDYRTFQSLHRVRSRDAAGDRA